MENTKMPNEQEAGQTPDSLRLKQARERLRYREALEKIAEMGLDYPVLDGLRKSKQIALKALQEEGK